MNTSSPRRDSFRILLIATDSHVPGPSYSGNAVIRWGLIQGLKTHGVDLGFYHSSPTALRKSVYDGIELTELLQAQNVWLGQPGPHVNRESVGGLAQALNKFRPDIVLAYGPYSTQLVRASGYTGQLGIMSVDLEFLPNLYRLALYLQAGDMNIRLNRLRTLPHFMFQQYRKWRLVNRTYPLADFIINHAANHAAWYRKKFDKRTLYTPNPVAPLFKPQPERSPCTPPRFLLIGNLKGIATLTGLYWFSKKVYPLLEPHLAAGTFEIHIGGRGNLSLPLLSGMKLITQRGYIENLSEEMRKITAVLVPTPIRLGFRTRILEAFRYAVPVIAHRANAVGMPELIHCKNSLLASTGQSFADAVLKLAADPVEVERLGRAGLAAFTNELNSMVVARRILDFIDAEVIA